MNRNPQLDLLRGIAILLVLCRHFSPYALLARGGWIGVDLFFVLSGFLVSGLLFRDMVNGDVPSISRFYVRRGLKIYPAYFFFLLISYLIGYKSFNGGGYLNQILFVQNYVDGVWPHTWSLAIEEHFYLVLPLVLTILFRKRLLSLIPHISAALMLMCLGLRILVVLHHQTIPAYALSHNRIDSLFFGVMLGWVFHFHRSAFISKWWFPVVSCLLIAPCFILDLGHPFIVTVGLSLNTLAFGLLLLWTMNQRWSNRIIEQIGQNSYSIYLWQFLVQPFLPSGILRIAIAFIGCSFLGIVMAQIVEWPAIRVRDRFFPSTSSRKQNSQNRRILVPSLS